MPLMVTVTEHVIVTSAGTVRVKLGVTVAIPEELPEAVPCQSKVKWHTPLAP
jgi:hypothetical protein